MRNRRFTPAAATAAAAGLALLAIAPGSTARGRGPDPAYDYAPPPAAGAVGLPGRLVADASAYEAYMARAAATSPGFTSGMSVASALRTGAAYEPKALVRGAVAYGAIAALGQTGWVASLRAAANTPENRRLLVNYIVSDPTYAFNFRGADAAAGLAKEAMGAGGARLYVAGKTVKQSAYDVQHQAWSRDEVVNRAGRLAETEAAGSGVMSPARERMDALSRAASGVEPLGVSAPSSPPPYTLLVAKALQLAAIAAIGEATDEAYDQLAGLTVEGTTDTCLHMAKLNLYQCLAVSKPHYEDIFCIGQHALADTGSCLAKSAGVDLPTDAAPEARRMAAAR